MKSVINSKMLVYWLMGNAVLTICFGLILALICLFPTAAPALRTMLAEGIMARFVPYIIFILIVSSLISFAYYYDSRRR